LLNPADACYKIKKLYSHKLSGFYWVKGKCRTLPMRLYCDFETPSRQAYAFLNGKDTNLEVKKIDDMKMYCAKIGMEPALIREDKVKLLINFIRELGI